MNPTDKVDDLLAEAGAQWRASQPSAPEPDLDRITGTKAKHPKRRWLIPTLAAASVAAIATAALTILPDHNEPAVAPPASKATPQTAEGTTQAGRPSVDDLLVRNGDKVEVNGQIVAAPGKDPLFCPRLPSTLPVFAPGKEPAPSCPAGLSVKLSGLDVSKFGEIKGVRTGEAHVTGTWNDAAITVEQQSAYVPPVQPPDDIDQPRCPAPAGGWPYQVSNLMSRPVQAFLNARESQISGPILRYPEGRARKKPVVIEIGVAHGDLAAFRSAFEQVYQGNLCVVATKYSRAEQESLSTQVGELLVKVPGAYAGGGVGMGTDMTGIPISLLVVTEQVKTALSPLGLQNLHVVPDVRPVR
jgi:hypothetical protein